MAEAAELRRWLDSGANAVKRARGRLDAINVFPVADADTGTNIYLTLREGNRAVGDLPLEATHKEVVAAFARGALLGARGNGHRPAQLPPTAMRSRPCAGLHASAQSTRSLSSTYFCQGRDLLGSVARLTWLAGEYVIP